MLGPAAVAAALKPTLFAHFCAGENEAEVLPVMQRLKARGVGGILDYAAEADLVAEAPELPAGAKAKSARESYADGAVQCRVYDYISEAVCDRNRDSFLSAIRTVRNTSPRGFAAIKATALGHPTLMDRTSTALMEVRRLFKRFDQRGDGRVTQDDFAAAYQQLFRDSSPQRMDQVFRHLDTGGDGHIDYLEWSKQLRLDVMHAVVGRFRGEAGKAGERFKEAVLEEEELQLFAAMRERLRELVHEAAKADVRVMVDAEHTYFQPAIDQLVLELQREYNGEGQTVVYNTYQTYLRSCERRLDLDIQRAEREGFAFGAKLVRGAYLVLERERAREKGYSDPVHPDFEATTGSFHRSIDRMLLCVAAGGGGLMVASHNRDSVAHTLAGMAEHGIPPGGFDGGRGSTVSFGQLFGMADDITFSLGQQGYCVFKYLPYGRVDQVVPYLIRRAQENSEVLSGSGQESRTIRQELQRRLLAPRGHEPATSQPS